MSASPCGAPYPEAFLCRADPRGEVAGGELLEGHALRRDGAVSSNRADGGEPCTGLFEVRKLIENKERNRPGVSVSGLQRMAEHRQLAAQRTGGAAEPG